ncbi:hypothetical protein CERSUDRAFT_118350 [Gelatoporia subvermispora B]|uniref:Uncharacterized protein n=1 Tax=Ceriporiopsis subvermispora (strain B) TaxID=914234 RepID=M2PBJ5_CERS8|nr:hypothetical protein CERSUDRAFT_118350 [Gelatoporia subvermispora B]
MTGGAGAGQIKMMLIEQFRQLPPEHVCGISRTVPAYTTVASVITLLPMSPSEAASASSEGGDVSDMIQLATTIGGCECPDVWDIVGQCAGTALGMRGDGRRCGLDSTCYSSPTTGPRTSLPSATFPSLSTTIAERWLHTAHQTHHTIYARTDDVQYI